MSNAWKIEISEKVADLLVSHNAYIEAVRKSDGEGVKIWGSLRSGDIADLLSLGIDVETATNRRLRQLAQSI